MEAVYNWMRSSEFLDKEPIPKSGHLLVSWLQDKWVLCKEKQIRYLIIPSIASFST